MSEIYWRKKANLDLVYYVQEESCMNTFPLREARLLLGFRRIYVGRVESSVTFKNDQTFNQIYPLKKYYPTIASFLSFSPTPFSTTFLYVTLVNYCRKLTK